MVQPDRSTLVTVSLASGADYPSESLKAGQPRPFQIKSYRHLLRFPLDAGNNQEGVDRIFPPIDAIIVPTIRPAEQLRCAAELAKQARCQLITFHTESFPDRLAAALATLAPGAASPLALRSDARHHVLDLGTDLPQSLVPPPAVDISKKRNLGLLIGRACGWTRMLFLDDDIRALDAEKLKSATPLLPNFPVVGFQVRAFPDASVVGHVRRKTGYGQEPFISGGSMLVDPQRLDGFFPPVYHEDWLCIINHLRRGEVTFGGTVRQLSYQPFNNPGRAVLEEFGDILACGLLWLVHARNRGRAAECTDAYSPSIPDGHYWHDAINPSFWQAILHQRAALLDNLIMRLKVLGSEEEPPVESLEAAKGRLRNLSPQEFVSFTEKWLSNLAAWRNRVANLPTVDSVAKALVELGLSDVVRTYQVDSRQVCTITTLGARS
jgi:hypothetical protein